jgi:hypothetical protein
MLGKFQPIHIGWSSKYEKFFSHPVGKTLL